MQRNGLNGGTFTTGQGYTAGTFGMIDNMTYNYNDANQLTKIVDASLYNKGYTRSFYDNTRPIDRTYDANGNMITDVGKRIMSNIIYNHLNLPMEITIDGYKIQFIYDATGVKLQKRIVYGGGRPSIIYDYVGGVEYKNNILERIANTEGAVTRNGITNVYEYEYALRDHLGNTRATFSDANNDGTVTSADIKQINHYYPFGLNMEGNWTPKGANGEGNKYQYNGKEWNDDFGLGWNDYGARFYDAAIGRWNAVDPLAEKYYRWSPYNYTKDNPIKYIDPTGMSTETDYYNQKGKKIGTDGVSNGNVVVITDKKEAKAIEATDKKGGTTAESDVKSGVGLPSAFVRGEMGKAVERSNARNDKRTDEFKGDDNEGGFHEEGGKYGKDEKGNYQVVHAKPGDKTDPLDAGMASVDVSNKANTYAPLIATEGTFHVHPRGTRSPPNGSIGGKSADFNQSPTPVVDYGVAGRYPGNSFVLGAGNNTVTIHNGTGDVATFPLDKFISIGNK